MTVPGPCYLCDQFSWSVTYRLSRLVGEQVFKMMLKISKENFNILMLFRVVAVQMSQNFPQEYILSKDAVPQTKVRQLFSFADMLHFVL